MKVAPSNDRPKKKPLLLLIPEEDEPMDSAGDDEPSRPRPSIDAKDLKGGLGDSGPLIKPPVTDETEEEG